MCLCIVHHPQSNKQQKCERAATYSDSCLVIIELLNNPMHLFGLTSIPSSDFHSIVKCLSQIYAFNSFVMLLGDQYWCVQI